MLLIGLMADVISANRKLTEELLYRVRSMELSVTNTTSPTVDPPRHVGLGEP